MSRLPRRIPNMEAKKKTSNYNIMNFGQNSHHFLCPRLVIIRIRDINTLHRMNLQNKE